MTKPQPLPPVDDLNPPTGESSRRSHWGPLVLVIAVLAVGGWFWYRQTAPISNTLVNTPATATNTPTVASQPATATEQIPVTAQNDAATKQLRAVSTQIDTATLRAELKDTNTGDLTPELDTLEAAVNSAQ